jgi:molybdopterin-binding protein
VNGTIVTASITNEAVDELKLAKGMLAYAVIKASDVTQMRRIRSGCC